MCMVLLERMGQPFWNTGSQHVLNTSLICNLWPDWRELFWTHELWHVSACLWIITERCIRHSVTSIQSIECTCVDSLSIRTCNSQDAEFQLRQTHGTNPEVGHHVLEALDTFRHPIPTGCRHSHQLGCMWEQGKLVLPLCNLMRCDVDTPVFFCLGPNEPW